MGRRIAIDTGKARVGLAVSDEAGVLSFPLSTVKRSDSLDKSCQDIGKAIMDYEVLEIYVGYPLSLSGNQTASTKDALDIALQLSRSLDVPVRMIDERLSTVSAQALMHTAGKDTRSQRQSIDQASAAIILEQALEIERKSGKAPGVLVEELV
jgi:putative holliday junction resolvase